MKNVNNIGTDNPPDIKAIKNEVVQVLSYTVKTLPTEHSENKIIN